ncbi:MAG TPA: hypothetical protein VFE20_08720, partial [Thermoleophilia bacterium]|nr:hypothetical protein [Thermoleophilia bacterium]
MTHTSTTQQLYLDDAYRAEFEAHVVAVGPDCVALSSTAFYPGGGGQPSDVGTLEVGTVTCPVTGVWFGNG